MSGTNEMIEVNESKNTVLASVDSEILKKYMYDFNTVISELDNDIEFLKEEITKIKNDIDSTSQELTNKVKDISTKEEEEKERIKSSDDYTSESLIESAKILEKLGEEKKSLEESLKEKINEFNQKVEELEEKKSLKEKVKSNVENITEETEKKISDIIVDCTKKIDAINAALEVCDNEHLKQALTEEKEKMEKILDETKNSKLEEINKEMKVLSNGTEKEQEEVKDEIKTVEVKPIIVPKLPKRPEAVEISKTEIKSVDTKVSEQIEIPKLESVESTVPENVNVDVKIETEQKFIDKDREVIQIDNVPSDKVEQIKHSSVIKEGLVSFFQSINSGLVTPLKKNEAGMLKTIEDDNVKNASLDDMFYVGANIESTERVDIYGSLEDLKMRFNPERNTLVSKIETIVLLERDKVINETSNFGTVLSELKYSSGVDEKDPEVVFKLKEGYVLYNPYSYSVIEEDKKEMKAGM